MGSPGGKRLLTRAEVEANRAEARAQGVPDPPFFRLPVPDPPVAGWFEDPFAPDAAQARYHDGFRWTEFVARRAGRSSMILLKRPCDPGAAAIITNPPKPMSRRGGATLLAAVGLLFVVIAAQYRDVTRAAVSGRRGEAVVSGHCGSRQPRHCHTTLLAGGEQRPLHLEFMGVTYGGDRLARVRYMNRRAVLDTVPERTSAALINVTAFLLGGALLAGAVTVLTGKGGRVVWTLALAVTVAFLCSLGSSWSSTSVPKPAGQAFAELNP
jgi:hypothetical protein